MTLSPLYVTRLQPATPSPTRITDRIGHSVCVVCSYPARIGNQPCFSRHFFEAKCISQQPSFSPVTALFMAQCQVCLAHALHDLNQRLIQAIFLLFFWSCLFLHILSGGSILSLVGHRLGSHRKSHFRLQDLDSGNR